MILVHKIGFSLKFREMCVDNVRKKDLTENRSKRISRGRIKAAVSLSDSKLLNAEQRSADFVDGTGDL